MREMGETQPLDSQQFFYHHHHYGGALETLPEAESEEECSEAEEAPENNLLTTSCSSQASEENLEIRNASNDEHPIIRCESNEDDSIRRLEATIRHLKDELRECKDQNELLEFRLLEIEEIGGNPSTQNGCETNRKSGKNNRVRGLLPTSSDVALNYHGTEEQEVTNRGDYDRSSPEASHSCLQESRSSCSDCSDSLSFQESGIFDSQSVNDDFSTGGILSGYANSLNPREDISRELTHLTTQIENLVIRFTEGTNTNVSNGGAGSSDDENTLKNPDSSSVQNSPTGNGGANGSSSSSSSGAENSNYNNVKVKAKRGQDLTNELKSCRQRIQEFERRLTQFADVNYVNSLEDKVNLLVQENQRLEEERSELEEAENDCRLDNQRLEEKMAHLRQKKILLQRQLSSEKLFIEQLRIKIIQLQEREEDLSSQILRVDALVQNYECHNFELEEACIEMKCSVKFVCQSLPILVLWYLWSILKKLESFRNSSTTTITACSHHHHHNSRLTTTFPALPCPTLSSSSSRVTMTVLPPPRKHKLTTTNDGITSTEPRLKKLRGGDGERKEDGSFSTGKSELSQCQCQIDCQPSPIIQRPALVHAGLQTSEEAFKSFVDDIISAQQHEWAQVENSLKKKIQLLECDIEKHQNMYDAEREKLVEIHDEKLSEQANALEESQNILMERKHLQEKWESLVKELEHFVVNMGVENNNSNDKCTLENERLKVKGKVQDESSSSSVKKVEGEKSIGTSGSLVANRIKSLFPGEWRGAKDPESNSSSNTSNATPSSSKKSIPDDNSSSSSTANTKSMEKNELITRLEQAFQEQLTQFERREKLLLDEIDRLKQELTTTTTASAPSMIHCDTNANNSKSIINASMTDHHLQSLQSDTSEIVYLAAENNRLQKIILSDQENVLSKVKELEEENEKLSHEIATNATLMKRLEDSYGAEKACRNRIEELEQNEIFIKEAADQVEKREKKCLDRISQLREEIQFLRNKCCQLQDDVDSKIQKEDKYKNEIQVLTNKVKALVTELEEKENFLENNAASSQSQIAKLRAQLNDVNQQMADAECSNGMLREEVLYLERTLQEAVDRGSKVEKAVGLLTSELQQRESLIETLQKELEQNWTAGRRQDMEENQVISNDLDIFAQNEGGLLGVDREIKTIASQVQSCSRESCKTSAGKLTEVSEQLKNYILLTLTRVQPEDRVSPGFPERLSRCESDECLSRSTVGIIKNSQLNGTKSAEGPKEALVSNVVSHLESELEDRDAEIMELRENMLHLQSQMGQIEELFNDRQKDLRKSHLAECEWYNARCKQKNDLIKILGRRIAHLSATDRHGIFLETIIQEIRKLEHNEIYPTIFPLNPKEPIDFNELDFTYDTLALFMNYERKRILNLMESTCQDENAESLDGADVGENPELEFRISKKISEDSLLVSWTIPEKYSEMEVQGYEISVNGKKFISIPKPNRFKVVLFGLNLTEPLHLSLKCTGGYKLQESTITYIP